MACWKAQLLLLLFTLVHQQTRGQPSTCGFIGAVYEHAHVGAPDALTVIQANLDVFERQVAIAASRDAQIIVFPEYGITGTTWDSTQDIYYQRLTQSTWNPCLDGLASNYTLALYRLSCMARANGVIVVANLPTSVPCTAADCPLANRTDYRYNTDVVFDVHGQLLATYFKMNLYGEPEFDQPPDNPTYFDTSFGRFGLVTCFDLLWAKPTVQLVLESHVDTILFPTAWMDQLPYLASVQAQSAWAHGLNVNLMAANQFFPQEGFMGSGLYSGVNGPVSYVYSSEQSNGTLLLAQLPCNSSSSSSRPGEGEMVRSRGEEAFHFIKHEDMSVFVGSAMGGEGGRVEVCQGSMCCSATYQYTVPSSSPTAGCWLLLHQGSVSEGSLYTFSAEVCSVLWCDDGQLSFDTCAIGQTANNTVTFDYLTISSNFTTPLVFPSVLTNQLELLPNHQWSFDVHSNDTYIDSQLSLSANTSTPLVAVTLYARKYQLDP